MRVSHRARNKTEELADSWLMLGRAGLVLGEPDSLKLAHPVPEGIGWTRFPRAVSLLRCPSFNVEPLHLLVEPLASEGELAGCVRAAAAVGVEGAPDEQRDRFAQGLVGKWRERACGDQLRVSSQSLGEVTAREGLARLGEGEQDLVLEVPDVSWPAMVLEPSAAGSASGSESDFAPPWIF